MEQLLAGLEDLLLYVFAFCALVGAALVVVLRQPMRVAMALISTMVFLGGIYGLLGVHFIAAFQVLIYVGAVMVFMVYTIMLLDVRDPAIKSRFSRLLVPGVIGGAIFLAALVHAVNGLVGRSAASNVSFGLKEFSVAFLNEYWLHFELTSVLLLAAVVAALAVIKGSSRHGGETGADRRG
jgi:NADH-quinone oxidoreductase subunit J